METKIRGLPNAYDNHIASIKLFPYKSLNRKDAWGYLTKQAVAVSDVMFPRKNICYCMAITAEDCEKGKPSSWSGSIDGQITHLAPHGEG